MERRNTVQNKLHHLAQFLAAFGNSYLPKAGDDSQSNLEWSVNTKALLSRTVHGIQMALHFQDLKLKIAKDNNTEALYVPDLSHDDIDFWIRKTLAASGLDADAYHHLLGFNLETEFNNFTTPDAEDEKAISDLIRNRDLAHSGLEEIQKHYESTTEIRVWPHHFDTGMLIDMSKEKNLSKGIGLGYAVADAISKTPYFYTYAWSNKDVVYENLPELTQGTWVIEDWKGAIMPVNTRHDTNSVNAFYQEIAVLLGKRIL